MRICVKCKINKPETSFYAPASRKVCKRCKNLLTPKTSRDYRANTKILVLKHYSTDLKCACPKCPFPYPGIDFLSLDHIKGRGKHDRKIRKMLYQWVKVNKFPDGFQVLCYNCNLAKSGKAECPHEIMKGIKEIEK